MNEPQPYTKKPITIEALQLDGSRTSARKAAAWVARHHHTAIVTRTTGDTYGLRIRTLEGDMEAQPGDWVIKGVAGEFYPCKPTIFDATYTLALDRV